MMSEMKTIPPNEYVRLINNLNGETHSGGDKWLVTFTISGEELEQRTHLGIPRAALSTTASSVVELRQKGIFCFPILAPLDEHHLI
jgi:hypothetical protein